MFFAPFLHSNFIGPSKSLAQVPTTGPRFEYQPALDEKIQNSKKQQLYKRPPSPQKWAENYPLN